MRSALERDELAALRQDVERLRAMLPDRVDVDPDSAGAGLAKLVLTLIEFLRQLLERQAIRRMEGGTLSEDEIERMGTALMRLEEKVRELAAHFGLREEDLNIGLGPVGKLL